MGGQQSTDDFARTLADLLGIAAFFLDDEDRVQLVNRYAADLVERRRGLGLRNGGLVTDWPEETSRLRRALRCLRTGPPEVTLAIARRACRCPLTLRLARLDADAICCVVLAVDPTFGHDIEPAALRAWYGLTFRESQVAAQLARGRPVDDVAAALGITRGTTTTHLKHIYCKLGINSQAQLVHLLSILPRPVNGSATRAPSGQRAATPPSW